VRALLPAGMRLLSSGAGTMAVVPARSKRTSGRAALQSLLLLLLLLLRVAILFPFAGQADSRSRGNSNLLLLNSLRKANASLLSPMKPNDESSTRGGSHG